MIPTGELVTVPLPDMLTERTTEEEANVAVTVVPVDRVTVQLAVPLHPPPPHPLKEEPVAGVAVRVTAVP